MMSGGWTARVTAGATVIALLTVAPRVIGAQDTNGFDGYIQSGTCATPTEDLRVTLTSEGDNDVEPYLAKTGADDGTVVLGYYGSPGVPGFGFSAIYTDQAFSLVITEAGDPVACGDILQPDQDEFAEAGAAVVQLLPVADSAVQGMAVIERAALQRELDVTPTRVRVLLSTSGEVATTQPVAGFDGSVQDGTCVSPGNRLRVSLESGGDHDVTPFLAQTDASAEPFTVAYYGAAFAPGFGLAAVHTDQSFSLVVTDTEAGDPVACGDILQPADDDSTEAGLALVQVLPVGDSGVNGFALIERIALQRELDVTPTRVRILLFAPPVTTS
jgi:hypothetical protein